MKHDVLEFQDAIVGGMQLHFAVQQGPPDSPYKLLLSSALRVLQRALGGGRLVLQGLRSTSCIVPPGTLEEAFFSFRDELPPGVAFQIIVTGKSKALKPAIQEQLYLMGREALVNALRHSRATSIEAEIGYLPHRLRIFVRDNGCGMDPQVVRAGQDGHCGLRGMRERADSIGAQLRIWSRPGAGTEVEISIAGNIAAST